MDAAATLVAHARRHRRRGDTRKMFTSLRQACAYAEDAAWLWTLYGALLGEHGRHEDAARTLGHALWLRRRAGDAARVRSTQALIERLGLPAAA